MKILNREIKFPWSNKTQVDSPVPKFPATPVPPGRTSSPPREVPSLNSILQEDIFVKPDFVRSMIPVLRRLYKVNSSLGLALFDTVQLTNTGHIIKFDKSVSPEQRAEMREHLNVASRRWGDGVSGIDGLVNRLIAQIFIGGASSSEWVIRNDLKGIDTLAFINPETIEFKYNWRSRRYEAYQRIVNNYSPSKSPENVIKLNPNTYQYFGLLTDTEIPYGTPPFLACLEDLVTQKDMKTNIAFIVKQLGLMGFTEALLEKPAQNDDESETRYLARLDKLLKDTKKNLHEGMSDGLIVGYKNDHEFNFNSTTKDIKGLTDIFNLQETQIANGLKTPPVFMGVPSGTTETQISVVFTKMLSQLKNVHQMLSAILEYGYILELTMAGFKFKTLTVQFNPSTITDDLKFQQAREIKIRNLSKLCAEGVIDKQTYAEELQYEKPANDDVIPMPGAPANPDASTAEKKQVREKGKDASDKKVRDKNRPTSA